MKKQIIAKLLCVLTLFIVPKFALSAGSISITYGVTVSDEWAEIDRLLHQLLININDEDRILVLRDLGNTNENVSAVLKKYSDRINKQKLVIIEGKLNNDFASFKNNLIKQARGTDYLFQIDADETLSDGLLRNVKWFLTKHPEADVILVPRINTYLDDETDLEFQNWLAATKDEQNRIRFPDWQNRIVKLSNHNIKFVNKVHEVLKGFNKLVKLPEENHWSIIHIKTNKMQAMRNKLYEKMQSEAN